MYHYVEKFEEITRNTNVLPICSSTIHVLANQYIWQTPKDRRQIIEAKFYSLYQMYLNFFKHQAILNENLLNRVTLEIPHDTLIIRYAYHSSIGYIAI